MLLSKLAYRGLSSSTAEPRRVFPFYSFAWISIALLSHAFTRDPSVFLSFCFAFPKISRSNLSSYAQTAKVAPLENSDLDENVFTFAAGHKYC
ncbi:uncharacterized [Tachysurus ichikawai]